MKIDLKYGRSALNFNVADKNLIGIASFSRGPVVSDIEEAFEKAVKNPSGPGLEDVVRRGDRVLLLTVDFTRPSPQRLIEFLVPRLERMGAKMDIMVGLGNHRRMTDGEMKGHLGTADAMQNEADGPFWNLGKTSFGTPVEVDARLKEYDVRIAVGFVEPSYLLGFTGGRKIIMPGVASPEAIAHNHFMLLTGGRKMGILKGNPLHEDALQFAKKVGLHWIVDVVLNPDDGYSAIYCGGMEEASSLACRDSAAIYSYPLSSRADVVVASAGGHPYDFDLVQTKKSVVPAMEYVRDGGVIILVGECPDGWGAEGYVSRQALTGQSPGDILSELYSMFEKKETPWEYAPCSARYLFARAYAEKKCRIICVTGINDELSKTFLDTASSVQEALAMAGETVGRDPSVFIIPDGRRLIPA